MGICRVAEAWFYRLDSESWREIRDRFAEALCAPDHMFWQTRASVSYATLMQLQDVTTIEPIRCAKRDRRGWVVLLPGSRQGVLNL